MTHYKSNLRDLEFNLFEALRVQDYLEAFEGFDRETAVDMLSELDRLAREDLAASFVDADRIPLELENGEVALPESLKESLDAIFDGGWHMLGIPPEMGGFGAPDALRWAGAELLLGANPTAYLYTSGILIARVIAAVGTAEQAAQWAQPMVDRRWGGTMVLTEPDAGSDVGAGTAKAVHVEGSTYHIEGVKRFITSGEGDYFENIIHLVLARREGGEPGTKGLSMFIVPKFNVNEDGTLGARNGVYATNIEKKMGIKGSTTCELTFGMDEPAVGYLVGEVHNGIRQMFEVIEDARMMVGVKSAATLSTGYLNALEYAQQRVQSADLSQMTDKTAPRVEIIRHPDVRRMLMLQKAHVEGMRALFLFTASVQDRARLDPSDPYWGRLNNLLLPLVKGYCSEKGYELLAQSLQVFGGSGYTLDYPIEQYLRDAKIDTLYEGTTGIQGLDLFFRKIARDRGATLVQFTESILDTVKGGREEMAAERQMLGSALEDVQAHIAVLVNHSMASMEDPPEIYRTGLHTTALLESLAELIIGWLLIRHAEVAIEAMESADGDDHDFYEGKIAAARFFSRHAFPKGKLRRQAAEDEDGSLMELPASAF